MRKPILGVLGGLGPLATTYLMQMVILKTPARTDQDNIPMIVLNDPQIPDRTAYILDHSKPCPLPEMTMVARRLEESGADYLAIPCNTAHYFYDGIVDAVSIPVLNIMTETVNRLVECAGKEATIGIMATEGTIASGVFQDYFASAGMRRTITPTESEQACLTSLIYDCVKANKPYDEADLLRVAEGMRSRGCDAVIVGCTELSVIYVGMSSKPDWLYDSLDILADRCVSYYLDRQG